MKKVKRLYALGPEGTYGHEAATLLLAGAYRDHELKLVGSHADVLNQAIGNKGLGLVAIENSTEGYVGEVLRKFWLKQRDPLPIQVIGEVSLRIRHCLLGHTGIPLDTPRRVLSHPQALGQCSEHLRLDSVHECIPTNSTAEAARLVAQDPQYRNDFAIAGSLAATIYGLTPFETNYQDEARNTTRFQILGHETPKPTGRDRTALICWPKENIPGTLEAYGAATAGSGVNMSRFHSMQLGAPNEDAFYIELDEHFDSKRGHLVRRALAQISAKMLVLGSYPQETKGGGI